MAKIIQLIGQKRGGTYIIAKWMEDQFKGNGYDVRSFAEVNPKRVNEDLSFYTSKEANIDKTDKRCLIYTINDYHPSDIPFIEDNIKKAYEIHNIIYLRDAYNLYASRMKINLKPNISNYLTLAYEFLNATNFFDNKLSLNFNKYIQEKEYRKNILNYLNIDMIEEIDQKILTKIGPSPSSFSGYTETPTAESLLTRWKFYINDPSYKKLLQNQELKKMTDQIFGMKLDMPTN